MRGVKAHTWAEPTAAGVPHTARQTWGSFLARQPSCGAVLRDLGLRVRHLGVGLGVTIQCLDLPVARVGVVPTLLRCAQCPGGKLAAAV